MHGALNQYEWLVSRARPGFRDRRVGRCASPWILFPIDECESGIADIVAAVGVYDGDVRGSGDVEGVAADDGFVVEGDGAGDEGELGLGDVGAGLEEAPLAAVLIGPASPGLSNVVLGVEGGVVCGVAFVCCLAACNTGLDEGYVDVADEVEHLSCEGCGLRGVTAGCY